MFHSLAIPELPGLSANVFARAKLRKAMTLAGAQEQQEDVCVYLFRERCAFLLLIFLLESNALNC